MIEGIDEDKATAFILRRAGERCELLAFRVRGSAHRFFRLPGGGVEAGETPLDAAYREIWEESGIARGDLSYLRKVGKLEYYKPGVHKRVVMHDYLFLHGGESPDAFPRVVGGQGKDRGYTFDHEWLGPERLGLLDPELAQLLNPYNTPEFFIDARDLGLERDRVVLRPHNAEWKRIYEFQEMEIRRGGEGYFRIDHVGSTSVDDLLAKPIIDILVGLGDGRDAKRLEAQLGGAGFICRGEFGVPGRLYFTKGTARETLFHVHAFRADDHQYYQHLAAAEALRASPGLRRKYEAYKLGAMGGGREAYTEGKGPIMAEILAFLGA